MSLDTMRSGGPDKGKDIIVQKKPEKVVPKTANTGETWYLDADRKVVVFDNAWTDELNRQIMEPGTPPSPGFPEFAKMKMEEMPVPVGEIAPLIPDNSAQPLQQEAEPQSATGPDVLPTPPPEQDEPEELPPRPDASQDHPQDAPQEPPQPDVIPVTPPDGQDTPPTAPPGPPAPPQGPTGGGPTGGPDDNGIDPYLVIGNRPQRRLGRRTDSFEIDPKRYIDVKNMKGLREVLANEREAQLFGMVLKAINPNKDDVLDRYVHGNPTKEDMDFLTYGVHEYALSSYLGEAAGRIYSSKDTELLARRNKDMLNLHAQEGEPRATEVAKQTILRMAMTDPDAAEDMLEALKQLERDRSTLRFKRSEEKVETLCKRVNIEPQYYGAVFDAKDIPGSEKLIAERIHEKAGKFRRAIDWVEQITNAPYLPGSSRNAAMINLQDAIRFTPPERSNTSPTSWVLDRINNNLESIAEHLGPTIGNTDMRLLISQEVMHNENKLLPIENGPRTFTEVQRLANDTFSVGSIKTRVENMIHADPEWQTRTPEYQNAQLENLKQQEVRQQQGGGFFAWLFSVLFSKNFNQAASSAAGRPVHV